MQKRETLQEKIVRLSNGRIQTTAHASRLLLAIACVAFAVTGIVLLNTLLRDGIGSLFDRTPEVLIGPDGEPT